MPSIPGEEGQAFLLIDTSIPIEFLRKSDTAVAWLDALSARPAISPITIADLYAGARSQRDERDRPASTTGLSSDRR
jgi:predicted nucleic acid-binding protein